MQLRTIRDSVQLAFDSFGSDQDALVLLIPGAGAPAKSWPEAFCRDLAATWRHVADMIPAPGLLCNNPRAIENVDGSPLKRSLVFFGWEGPVGMFPEGAFKGRAYLW